jgi:hypothetical protein
LKNIKSVEEAMAELNIEFVGVEYTYAKTKKRPPLDMEKVKKKCEILIKEKRWISDKEMEDYGKNPNFVKPVS